MKKVRNQKLFAFLTALVVCVLIFSVFMGQILWSDILTFHKGGDDLQLCFPSLKKLAAYLQEGVFQGIDTDTFNGATEFFSRANLPQHYLPAVIIAYLMQFFPSRGIYLFLYFVQLFLCAYFSTRFTQRFFGMKNSTAFLFSCSWITVALYESWYFSFYLITTLMPVLLYFEFLLFETERIRWKECILFSLPYVLSITSGYITLSVALALEIFAMTVGYGILFRKLNVTDMLKRTVLPFAVGVGVCLPYCLKVFVYQKKVVQAPMTMFDALYYKLNVLDLKAIFSSAFIRENPVEQTQLITLGMFWVFIIILFLCCHTIRKMNREERYVLRFGVGISVLFCMIALETALPFAAWFCSLVPVFGSMHLPLRYLMTILLLPYLGMSLALEHLPQLIKNKWIKIAAIVHLLMGCFLLFITPFFAESGGLMEKFLVEVFLMAIIFYFIYEYGLRNRITVICSGFFILLPGILYFYHANEIDVHISEFAARSIVYDHNEQEQLDVFISGLRPKDRYLYAAFDQVQFIPEFIPGNYGWYGYSKYRLSNYNGYENHLSVPKDYRDRFPQFSSIDWEYVADTRGDFIILDQELDSQNKDVLDRMADRSEENIVWDETHQIIKLKKFIPSYYTGTCFVEDRADTMDNGYFYCPDLFQEDLTGFQTDHATYYQASVHTSDNCMVAFLLYPNRNYKYYVNGAQVEPIIFNMQAYIPVNKGNNDIRVVYKNRMDSIKNMMFLCYYVAVLWCVIYAAMIRITKEIK